MNAFQLLQLLTVLSKVFEKVVEDGKITYGEFFGSLKEIADEMGISEKVMIDEEILKKVNVEKFLKIF